MERKIYLGDAVYAEWDGWAIVLTTEEGPGRVTNTIVMEPEVLDRLEKFKQQIVAESWK